MGVVQSFQICCTGSCSGAFGNQLTSVAFRFCDFATLLVRIELLNTVIQPYISLVSNPTVFVPRPVFLHSRRLLSFFLIHFRKCVIASWFW